MRPIACRHSIQACILGVVALCTACGGGTSTTPPGSSPHGGAPAPPSAIPAYCANYSTPVPNANSAPQTVYFTDNSGTGAQVYLYVVTGAPPGGGLQTQYLAVNGKMVNFTQGASAPPLPLECFPGSTHAGVGLTFKLPPPTNAQQSANLYIAYATPLPGDASPPNPLQFVGTSTGGNTQPTLDWNTPSYAAAPFDYVEYTLPTGITDITQVDRVGLPIMLTQGSFSVGFATAAQYQSLLDATIADPLYKSTAVSAQLNGGSVLARILAPQNAENWGFPQDWWYNSTFNPNYSANGEGYVGYLLAKYQSTPRLYTLNGVPGLSGNYCASSDGTANILFYSVGSATSCAGPLGTATYKMNIAQTLTGSMTTDSYGVCHSSIFTMPYGGPGGPLVDLPEFYLWKAMVIDIARGVALQNGAHPISTWNTSPTTPVPFSNFYLDPVYNTYSYLVHKYMINNLSYALPYDEPGGLAPAFTSDTSQVLQITIQKIPTYSRTQPTTVATPLPCPTS
jgi:hypothetical protein